MFKLQFGQFTGETMQPDACDPAGSAPLLRTDYRCGCANQKYEWRARSQTCEQRECSPAQSERCHTANTVGCRVIGLAEQFECVCRWPFSGRSFCREEVNPCFVHVLIREGDGKELILPAQLCGDGTGRGTCFMQDYKNYTCVCNLGYTKRTAGEYLRYSNCLERESPCARVKCNNGVCRSEILTLITNRHFRRCNIAPTSLK